MIIKLNKKYKVTTEEAEKIRELDMKFFENESALLRGKAMPKKLKNEIDELYTKYLYHIQFNWSTTLLDAEAEDMKNDGFCNKNSNKGYWMKSYMLSWLIDLPERPTKEFFYRSITSREAYRELIKEVYKQIN